MAYIEPRRNKEGKITSYKLVVSVGNDRVGRNMKRRSIWVPPRPGMPEKQMEKEARQAAYEFERLIKLGFRIDENIRFEDYAEYVLDLKERTGAKPRTIDRYIELLKRINPAIGFLKLTDIRPQHLNMFYEDLQKNGAKAGMDRAVSKRLLKTVMAEHHVSITELGRRAGISASTVRQAVIGEPVHVSKAEAIAEALDCKFNEIFTITKKSSPLSEKTILEHHRLISTILAQAEKEMLVTYNAAAKATPPKQTRPIADYYQPDEMNEILTALDDAPLKWRAITYMLIDTGCRRGEAMGLKWDKVDLDSGKIIIDNTLLYSTRHGVYEGETKTGNIRAMFLAPENLEVLKQWRVEQMRMKLLNGDRWQDTGYVFTRDDGRAMHPDSITDWLAKFSKEKGLPHIHPHAFRHTVASTMIANGVDLVTAAGELGHANANTTTMIYAHQIAVAKAQAANIRAGVFANREKSKKKKKA